MDLDSFDRIYFLKNWVRPIALFFLLLYLLILGVAALPPALRIGVLGDLSRIAERRLFFYHLTPGFVVFSDDVSDQPIGMGFCFEVTGLSDSNRSEKLYTHSACKPALFRALVDPLDLTMSRTAILGLTEKKRPILLKRALADFFCSKNNYRTVKVESHYILWDSISKKESTGGQDELTWNCELGEEV